MSSAKHILLLPGLDGTGELFSGFEAALPKQFVPSRVTYPRDKFLPYDQLLPLMERAIPPAEPFVLLAESFSSPPAVALAAKRPPNLSAVVVCAGFASNPLDRFDWAAHLVASPAFFKMRPPDVVLRRYLLGDGAPESLINGLRRVIESVAPAVLSERLKAALNCDVRAELHQVGVPLLYLQAGEDRLISRKAAGEFQQVKPDVTIEVIRGPHLLLQREPQKAAAAVAAFLDACC